VGRRRAVALPAHGPKRTNVRVHHHDSVVKVQVAVVGLRALGEQKTRGPRSEASDGHLATSLALCASAFRERAGAERASCWVYRGAVRRRRVTKGQYSTAGTRCQMAGWTAAASGLATAAAPSQRRVLYHGGSGVSNMFRGRAARACGPQAPKLLRSLYHGV
jgi:hypothetical protein